VTEVAPIITTEGLLTSRDAFGLWEATPAQRAACRVVDGLPLGELADDLDVIELLGGHESVEAIERHRVKRDTPGCGPKEVAFLAAIRSAKTMLACAAAVRMTQTVDVSGLKHGEMPRVSVVSLKVDVAGAAYRMLKEAILASSILSALVIGTPKEDAIQLQHPSGRPIEIAVVAGARAGAGLVARWSAGVIFDEAPRMVGAEDGVVNLTDARSAVIGRLLPGAQALYIGSPWAPFGPAYTMHEDHWRDPKQEVVVLKGTGPMLNPTWWTPERCEALKTADPVAYQTDVLANFADPESGMFWDEMLRGCTRESPIEIEPQPLQYYQAAMDPATRGNSWTLGVWTCTGVDGARKKLQVVLARQWTGSRLAPLDSERILKEIASICHRYRISSCWTDQWSVDALRTTARRCGIGLAEETMSGARKVELAQLLKLECESRDVELPPIPILSEDLKRVRKRITQEGIQIVLPRTGDGRHCDYASMMLLLTAHEPRVPDPPPVTEEEYRRTEPQRIRAAEERAVDERNRQRWARGAYQMMRRALHLS